MYYPDLTIAYYCPHCNSSLIVHQALVQWHVEKQEFTPVHLTSKAICLKCETKFSYLEPVELTTEVITAYHTTTREKATT